MDGLGKLEWATCSATGPRTDSPGFGLEVDRGPWRAEGKLGWADHGLGRHGGGVSGKAVN